MGDMLLNVNRDTKERALKLYKVSAEDLEDVTEIKVGDIGALIGLKTVRTGDTITVTKTKEPVLLPVSLSFPKSIFLYRVTRVLRHLLPYFSVQLSLRVHQKKKFYWNLLNSCKWRTLVSI